jgi:hypothetical protein
LKPRETLSPYYSTLFENVEGNPRLTISYPIIIDEIPTETDNGEATTSKGRSSSIFNGVVVASIDVNTLGKVVENQLVSDYKSSVGLVDRNGVILYSSSSPQYIGKNIFGPEVQSILPSDVKAPFNHFIRDSLMGNTGSGDFTSQGKTSTVAYNPIMVEGNEFALMYIVTPHELATSATELITQQRILNIVIIIAIAGVAASISSILLIWNKRLNNAVTGKTQELKFANELLTESNRQLQVSNAKLEEANEQLLVHENMQRIYQCGGT